MNSKTGNGNHLFTFLSKKKRKEKDSDNEEEDDDESSISSDSSSSSSSSSSEESLLSGLSEEEDEGDEGEEENEIIQQPPSPSQQQQPMDRRRSSTLRLEKKFEQRQQTLKRLSARRSSSSSTTSTTIMKLLQMNEELVRQIKLEKYYNKKIHKKISDNNNNKKKTKRSCSIATETSSSNTSNTNITNHENNDYDVDNDNNNDLKQCEEEEEEEVPPPINNNIGTKLNTQNQEQQQQPWLWWWTLFEIHHTVPSSFKLVIICLCHLAFHGVLDATTRIVYHNIFLDYMDKQLFSCFLIAIGLILLRANGYLWLFLNDDSYRIVKFDMHNRLRLGCTDAKVLKFFKRETIYGSAANMFGFYFVYVGLNQIFSHNYANIAKFFETWYTQTKEEIITEQNLTTTGANNDDIIMNNSSASSSLVFYSWDGYSTGYSEPEHQTCLLLKQYVHPNLQWWFQYCCTDPFQEWKVLEITYFGLLLSVVATIGGYMGLNLLELCDEE